jgi:hypothetical protein
VFELRRSWLALLPRTGNSIEKQHFLCSNHRKHWNFHNLPLRMTVLLSFLIKRSKISILTTSTRNLNYTHAFQFAWRTLKLRAKKPLYCRLCEQFSCWRRKRFSSHSAVNELRSIYWFISGMNRRLKYLDRCGTESHYNLLVDRFKRKNVITISPTAV